MVGKHHRKGTCDIFKTWPHKAHVIMYGCKTSPKRCMWYLQNMAA